ncbi:Hsp20/alpha crystallin family protein [soil metagenome]
MTTYFTPTRGYSRVASAPRQTPVDLYRDGDTYVLSADMPGIDPKSVDVDIEGKTLTISAKRAQRGSDSVTWLARERSADSFSRRFTLGDGVDSSAISASYDNGVLNVSIPVSERAKPRKVTVAVAGTDAAAPVDASGEAPVEAHADESVAA